VEQVNENLEIIVSINRGCSDEKESLKIAQGFDDARVKVIRPPEELPMGAHYEWCIEHMTGDWGTILGADDGLLPWATELARGLIKAHPSVDALMFRRAYFFWPGVEDVYGNSVMSFSADAQVREVMGHHQLSRALDGRLQHYDLPQLYTNNFVRLEVVRSIRERQGRFYLEPTPDVYSGVAVSLAASRLLRCETPAFWTGTSAASTGLSISKYARSESTASRHPHLLNSERYGMTVAPEIGEDLWFAAQSSPIYVASAFLRWSHSNGISQDTHIHSWHKALKVAYVRSFGRLQRMRPGQDIRILIRNRLEAQGCVGLGLFWGLSATTLRLVFNFLTTFSLRVLGRLARRLPGKSAPRLYSQNREQFRRLSDAQSVVRAFGEELSLLNR
jgi:hypothetical protein